MTAGEIKGLRQALGLSQQALADRIGVNRVTLADWERGAHSPRGLYLKALEKFASRVKSKTERRKA